MQMPEKLSNEEKQDKLNSVVEVMDLHKCLHTGKHFYSKNGRSSIL